MPRMAFNGVRISVHFKGAAGAAGNSDDAVLTGSLQNLPGQP